jgi:hypothetical protein
VIFQLVPAGQKNVRDSRSESEPEAMLESVEEEVEGAAKTEREREAVKRVRVEKNRILKMVVRRWDGIKNQSIG